MSIFGPRYYTSSEPNFSGLFRLIDEFDKYSQSGGGDEDTQVAGRRHHHQLQTFTPKFDLKETEQAYELHGELPGVAKDNINLEFNDEQTITISGKVERSYTSGEDPDSPVVVEHHNGEKEKENAGKQTSEVAKTGGGDKTQVSAQGPKIKYWVSERSVGEFSRSFSFPERVNSEEVKASLINGILNVTVPKAKKPLGRRVAIN